MTAIYKKELKSYLTSMIGYLFMAFTLALFGLYFTAINLQQVTRRSDTRCRIPHLFC